MFHNQSLGPERTNSVDSRGGDLLLQQSSLDTPDTFRTGNGSLTPAHPSGTAPNQRDNSFRGFHNNSGLDGDDLQVDTDDAQVQHSVPFHQEFPGDLASLNNLLDNAAGRSRPRYPEYSMRAVRITSYRSWAETLKPAAEMADAGFYSTGNGDCVRCFQCGIGLKNWDPEDDPYVEHARWSNKCAYLLEKKGKGFIDLVQAAVRQAEIEETLEKNSRSSSSLRSQHDDDLEADAPPQGQRISRSNGYRPTAAEKKNPLLSPAAQSALAMGYLPKVVKRAVDIVLDGKGWVGMKAENVMEVIFDIEEHEKDSGERLLVSEKPKPIVNHSSNVQKDSATVKKELRTENSELKERMTCKICCENTVSIVFLPCGHLVCCAQCSPALKDCAVCRTSVKGTVRISLAN